MEIWSGLNSSKFLFYRLHDLIHSIDFLAVFLLDMMLQSGNASCQLIIASTTRFLLGELLIRSTRLESLL